MYPFHPFIRTQEIQTAVKNAAVEEAINIFFEDTIFKRNAVEVSRIHRAANWTRNM